MKQLTEIKNTAIPHGLNSSWYIHPNRSDCPVAVKMDSTGAVGARPIVRKDFIIYEEDKNPGLICTGCHQTVFAPQMLLESRNTDGL